MIKKGVWLLVSLFVFGLPLAAQANNVLFVVVDAKANRAYVPEGSVLPHGLQIRAERADAPSIMDRPDWRRGLALPLRPALAQKRITAPAMVFEYAPAERFAEARRQYEAQHGPSSSRIKATDDRYCLDVYVTQQNTGIYGTYTNGLTATFCGPYNTVVGNAYLWEYIVTGDYSDDDIYINPYVGISDDNNHYNCYDEYYYSGDLGQCTASNTTVWTNTGCTDNVYLYGQLYVIEYMPQDPYHDSYVGFNLQVTFCTTFY